MSGTFEGLSVPLFGEFYRYSEAGTQNLYVEDDGVHNFTITKTGAAADALFSFAVTDETTFSSGYASVIYIAYAGEGEKTGSISGTQSNLIAMDITLNDSCSMTTGMYMYFMEGSGDGPAAGDDVHGIDIYIEELGQLDYLSCLHLEMNHTTTATSMDSFIQCTQHGSAAKALISVMTGHPTYLLTMTASEGGFLSASAMTQSEKYYIKVKIGASDFWIIAGTSG